MKKFELCKKMYDIGAMAIVRTESYERAEEIAQGCIDGGVPMMEMSYTFANAGEIIKELNTSFKDELYVGAGTVLDGETARLAIMSGAQFIIAPNYNLGVAQICNRYQIPYAPGCTSVTEAIEALSNGASFIKAFPISDFYGPKLVKVLKAPLPYMTILASGGISFDNIDGWLENGVDICGIGSLLTKGSVEEITSNAKKIRKVV
ncbi:MAG: ketohydroxyglutarate aldolase, partial [Tetragenococcus koreensis]|nr:ketohydroxyglutarate aldolase [Tetragenococcus koreensis]